MSGTTIMPLTPTTFAPQNLTGQSLTLTTLPSNVLGQSVGDFSYLSEALCRGGYGIPKVP